MSEAAAASRQRMRFGFVVHPLNDFQTRLLGVRSADLRLMGARASRRPPARMISRLQLDGLGPSPVQGLLVAIPNLPEDLLSDQERGVGDVLEAVRLCNGEGAGVVGLGAVTAVIGAQGKAVADAAPCAVTSGNALTAWAAVATWRRWQAVAGGPPTVGLFGLPGAVAGGILRLLVREGAEVRVVAASPAPPLARMVERCDREGPGRARFVADAAAVLLAGEVLVAASSTGGRLPLSALPRGAVVIDVAEPVDILQDVPSREDVLVLDGELVRLPGALHGTEPWQSLYGLVTGQRGRIFACFAEPMLLAGAGRPELAVVGRELPLERLLGLGALAQANGFSVDHLCEGGRPVQEARLLAFAGRRRA